ncbi:hypothetical protein AB4099_19035 [Bosea sp. 2KB_26]|uniref:hypothetical protein n=1 Tax=Bosea sp. 2KB_26 TaxID=3237475 RepID=UPI003F91360E
MRAIIFAMAMVASGTAMAAPGRCLLVVDGKTYLNGPCPVDVSKDGGFSIGTGPKASYFAYVTIDRPGVAKGYWNEERGASHAHTDLGELRRNDACWTNDKAIVCAWR